MLINWPPGQVNVPALGDDTLPATPSTQEPVAHNLVAGDGTTQEGVLTGGETGGETAEGVLGAVGTPGPTGEMGTHNGIEAQQVGAATEFQIKEQAWPAGVVPVAGVVGAAPQPGDGGGGATTGGGAGGGEAGGGNDVGGVAGKLTGGSTFPAKPEAAP